MEERRREGKIDGKGDGGGGKGSRRTFLDAIFLVAFVVGVFLLDADPLGAFVVVVFERGALGGAGAFYVWGHGVSAGGVGCG